MSTLDQFRALLRDQRSQLVDTLHAKRLELRALESEVAEYEKTLAEMDNVLGKPAINRPVETTGPYVGINHRKKTLRNEIVRVVKAAYPNSISSYDALTAILPTWQLGDLSVRNISTLALHLPEIIFSDGQLLYVPPDEDTDEEDEDSTDPTEPS